MPILSLLIFVPLAGALLLLVVDNREERRDSFVRVFTLGVSLVEFALAIFVWARFAGLYRLLLNKYYVDEVYDAAVVKPIVEGSEHGLWRTVDAGLIDGSVNGIGRLVRGAGGILRLAQTGSIRAYAASLFIGVVLVLAYYVWR